MTFVIAITGKESIWIVADRRLTYARPRPAKDDARKIMFLGASDATAILAYAGLGETGRGVEPSDWMSNVLRGVPGNLHQKLNTLGDAAERQLRKHLAGIRSDWHDIVAIAFVGNQPRIYTVKVGLNQRSAATGRHVEVAYHYVSRPGEAERPLRAYWVGSGQKVFEKHLKDSWLDLARLINAHDHRRVGDLAVADRFAELMLSVSKLERTVGSNSIVAWRYRTGGVYDGGGGHQMYEGTERKGADWLPIVGHDGMDIRAVIQAALPHLVEPILANLETRRGMENPQAAEVQEIDEAALDRAVRALPFRPDETLE